MCRKIDKTLHGNCTSIPPPFSAYRTQLTGKQVRAFVRAYNFGLETTLRF
jgi:hypothetical protein